MDAHSLLFGTSTGNNDRGNNDRASMSEDGDDSSMSHLDITATTLMRNDSLTHSSSLHTKLHQTEPTTGPRRTMGSMSSTDGASDKSYQSRKKDASCCLCLSCLNGSSSPSSSNNHTTTNSKRNESIAADEDGYYEVVQYYQTIKTYVGALFGTGNDHAAYDRHRHDVNRLLTENPKEFPPFFPTLSLGLLIAFAISSGYIIAIFFVPADWLKWVPAPVGDEWDDDYLLKNNGWEVRQVLLAYSSIPIVSCIFTYFHIWLALWMMFYPIAFLGCWQIPGTNLGFPMGWQGIVPFKAIKMVEMSVDIILGRLIDMKSEFGKIKPEMVAAILKPSLAAEVASLYPTIAKRHKAGLWERLPEAVQDAVVSNGVAMASTVVADLMQDIQMHLTELIDVKSVVTDHFLKHPALINAIFIQCGYQELTFIRNSGGVFGFLFGLIQMIVWLFWHPNTEEPLHASLQALIVFPVFGLIVGAATNWISLLVIFSPVEPFDVLKFLTTGSGTVNATNGDQNTNMTTSLDKPAETSGTVTFSDDRIRNRCFPNGLILQGLFLQRQTQVSRVYGRLVGSEVLTVSRINDALLNGTTVGGPQLLNELMTKHFTMAFDKSLDAVPTILQGVGINAERLLGEEEVEAMRKDSVSSLLQSTPKHLNSPKVVEYFEGALGMEMTLRERMEKLPPQDFEQILHPVFQEDEWKLIAVGGGLGVVIGMLQAFFIN